MKNWVKRNYKGFIISAFLIPIITVAIVSISHVTTWYGISNPLTWAVYLSIGIEIAALSALAAISADMGSKVYFPFGIVTLIQFIGNIYFSYQFIDIDNENFKDWVELVSPLLEYMGVESNDFVGHKRFLSLFAGGMLPIISLSFLHMLVKFTQENKFTTNDIKENENKINNQDLMSELTKLRLSDDDLKMLEKYLVNPPEPSQELKKAAENYKTYKQNTSELNSQITDSVTSGKPVAPSSFIEKADELLLDEWEKKLDFGNEKANQQEDWESYNKLMDLQMDAHTESSIPPKNASEMMITSNTDIIESTPSDEEKSELDLPIETQPVAIEELPENQPIPDSPNPAVEEESEKKKI
jgi:hypothetical protein